MCAPLCTRQIREGENDTITEREACYRCIASMWEYALSPLPDDPTLDAWKRDQAIMRALVRGELLPTTKHQLSSRDECPPLNMGERRQIRDAQTVLESLCSKYTDAFSEYDRDDLKRWIGEAEAHRAEQRQERREIARLAHVTEVQDQLFFALELAHKFDPAVRMRIEDETRRIKEAWKAKQKAPDKVRGHAAMADRAQETCDAYVKLLNELYAMTPTEEAKPNWTRGLTMAKRDKRRADPARQTDGGMLTKQELIAMLREGRTRAQDGLADIPEDRREYARRKEEIAICDLTLRRIGA